MRIGFQVPVTPIMEGITDFHNYIMFYLILILFFVLYFLYKIFKKFVFPFIKAPYHKKPRPSNWDYNFWYRKVYLAGNKFTHANQLELIWTLIPSFVLLLIAVPSFSLLYTMDELIDPLLTFKAIGHQWFWSYEYSDASLFPGKNLLLDDPIIEFSSYMINTADLLPGQFRLLAVDNPCVLPTQTHIRVLVTASDVLHSWAVPSFGVKLDCVPGRLNQIGLFIKLEGVYFGQCSELCGVNHGFMPINVIAVEPSVFLNWIDSKS